jgi:hypothetical protein
MTDMGRLLMLAGATLFVVGLLLFVGSRIPGFGQLPGDITLRRGNFTLFAPLGTMIVVSLVLTLLVNLIARFWR